jgi:PAS domain S-box-containing protein
MVRQAPVGICIIQAKDLFIQDVNDSYLELVGKTRNELENRTIWEAVPEAAETYAPIMNNVILTGVPFIAKEHEVILIRNKVPETVFLDFVYEPMHQDESVTAIMVLCIDVTDKVKARRSVEEMEERVRLAVDAADVGTFDADLSKNSIVTSGRFDKILGFEQAPTWEEIISIFHPDDLKKRESAHIDAYKNGTLNYEARVLFPDESTHWIKVQGKVSYDKDHQPTRIVGTLLDITNFKRLEQQKDDFISIASHELKTPITSLKASLQLLERMKNNPSSTMLPRLIEQSGKSMRKISSLVDDLLNVSRSSASQLKLNKTFFTLTDVINSCRDHIQVSGDYTLSVEGEEDLKLFADEHAIDQVIINLVNNAVKYAPESYEIILSIKKENNSAIISVSDKGSGIPEEKIAHLFDRYYQAQPSGFNNSGLGLGLYISADIIKRHGGEIGVVSEIDKGSTFWFTLPLV